MPAKLVPIGSSITLACELTGSGFPLILVMGYGGTKELWDPAFIAALAQHYQVLTFDNRGSGASSMPTTAVTMQAFAADIAALMDHYGWPQAHIVGVSMGGMIAQQFAVDHPGRVARLVLGATTCKASLIRKQLGLVGLLLLPHWPRLGVRALVSAGFAKRHPHALGRLVAYIRTHPASPVAARQQSLAINRFDVEARLRGLTLPVLVITGTDDRIINYENSLHLQGLIRGSQLTLLQGAGHLFPLEQPEATTHAILGFLSG